jgi:fatty acid desaturase
LRARRADCSRRAATKVPQGADLLGKAQAVEAALIDQYQRNRHRHHGLPLLTLEGFNLHVSSAFSSGWGTDGGRTSTTALGGLHYQIEHHLFPSMPPPAQGPALVRRYCDALGIDYLETGLLTSYQQALASLHQAGAPIRNAETV